MSKKIIAYGLLCAGLLLGSAGCRQRVLSEHSAGPGEILFDFQEITLPNGLRVVTLEDFSSPIVTVQVWYHVGSKNEDPSRQGFAHMFEHMMFKGTDRVGPMDHFGLLQRVGARTNGYTSFDKTVYLQTLPAEQIELALWLEAERMAFLKIDQEAVDTERKVVEEELRMGENKPYGNVFKKAAAALFTVHPYRWTPIGNIAHLRAASAAEMREFWNRYYIPNNAVLVIVGAVEHQKAQQLAEQYFGWIQARPQPPRVSICEPPPAGPRHLVIDDELAPAPLAGIVWRTVPHGHPDELPLDFLAAILGDGNSSRLYRRLVAETQAAVHAAAWTYTLEQDGVFATGAMLNGSEPNQIFACIHAELNQILQEGIPEKELEKARNKILKQVVAENLTIEGKAELLGTAALILGQTSKANELFRDIQAVKAEDVRRVIQTYLTESRQLTVSVVQNNIGKKDDGQAPVTAVREEQSPPPGRAGEKRPAHFPAEPPIQPIQPTHISPHYTEHRLANGLKVMVVPNHEVPFVSVMLGLPFGSWCEEKPAAASTAFAMLTKGTAHYTEAELAEELEYRAITLSGRASLDDGIISADCLSRHVEEAVRLLAEAVRYPTFDKTELEKLRQRQIASLMVREQSPDYQADRQLRKELFGEHPYARTPEGEPENLRHLASEDLFAYWAHFARPQKAVLIFAGDIQPKRAAALAQKWLGKWENSRPLPSVSLPEIPPMEPRHICAVDLPGSSQSQIRIGQLGITRRQQPEYFISRIVSSYFGGAFNSRLNQVVRVEKGLTYGIWGNYAAFNQAGTFIIQTFTKNDSVPQALETIFELIEDLRNRPPSPSELENTKTYIAGTFLLARETPQQTAEDLWLMESQNLGRDYLDKLLETVRTATAEDCLALVRETLEPSRMTIVVAGDKEQIPPLDFIAPLRCRQTPSEGSKP
jgi:zinc protease